MDHPEDNVGAAKPLGVTIAEAMGIGKKLAAARESRRLTLADLARRVRIREHFAHAIESGDWGSLPPGLNGRGLVRLYARELGVGVPELEPTSHLSASNAQVERAEKELAEETLRAQNIRTYAHNQFSVQNQSAAQRSHGPVSGRVTQPLRGSVPSGGAQTVTRTKGPEQVWGAAASQSPQLPRGKAAGLQVPKVPRDLPDDESPLDVVTPDIASLLGIDLQEDSRQSLSAGSFDQGADAADDVPGVNVAQVLGIGEELETLAPEQPGGQYGQDRDLISHADMDAMVPNTGVSFEAEAAGGPQNTYAPPEQTEHREQPSVSGIHSYVDEIARTWPEPGVAPGSGLDSVGAPGAADRADASVAGRTRSNQRMRGLLTLGVAAAALLAFGLFYLAPSARVEERPRILDLGQDAASPVQADNPETAVTDLSQGDAAHEAPASNNEVVAQEPASSESGGEGESGAGPPTVSSGAEATGPAAAGAVTSAAQETAAGPDAARAGATGNTAPTAVAPLVVAPTASAAALPEISASEAGTSPQPAVIPEASAPTPGASVPEAPTPETSAGVRGATPRRATLLVKEPVGIQIRVDGRVIAQGERQAGPLEFSFSSRAEIIIDDGSKVELDYADWSHGPLGHPGRKRRIVLNNSSF